MQGYKRSLPIRLYKRHADSLAWLINEVTPCLLGVVILAGMMIMTLLHIGDMPPGPVAAISPSHRVLADALRSPTPDLYGDPGPGITYASMAGQDLYEVEEIDL